MLRLAGYTADLELAPSASPCPEGVSTASIGAEVRSVKKAVARFLSVQKCTKITKWYGGPKEIGYIYYGLAR